VEATDISTPREKLYVLGIIIEPKTRRVALLRKKRPLWQQGLLNGIGGHIESGELPSEAMARECQEEVGLTLDWKKIGHFKTVLWEMWIFSASIGNITKVKGQEDEEIEYCEIDALPSDVIPNLRFLVPFALYNIYGDYMELTNTHRPQE
jgi:8-oxo-dGTP diphosphatase